MIFSSEIFPFSILKELFFKFIYSSLFSLSILLPSLKITLFLFISISLLLLLFSFLLLFFVLKNNISSSLSSILIDDFSTLISSEFSLFGIYECNEYIKEN